MTAPEPALEELERESTMGALGTEVSRPLPVIDLSDFDERHSEITQALWDAATDAGFFQITGHGIPAAQIDRAFEISEQFFALSEVTKAKYPLVAGTNAGWESQTQVRPSTGATDEKESYQLTRPRMDDLWPTEEEVAGFREDLLDFEAVNRQVAMRVLSCLATKLGFEADFFTERHNPESPDYQSTLRLLHYLPTDPGAAHKNRWRAGAHTDFDCLTLLHQRDGQHGLQLCPGTGAESDQWTPVEPRDGVITCNIGDMLMRWSDGQLPSTLHRVRIPDDDSASEPRYSIAFFAQADRDAMIESPSGAYPPISAADYLQQRIAANFAG